MEQTLVLIKPDAVGAHHIGDITKAYEEAGLQIRAMKMMQMTDRIARIHYAEHIEKPFYGELSAFTRPTAPRALHARCTSSSVRRRFSKKLLLTPGRASLRGWVHLSTEEEVQ